MNPLEVLFTISVILYILLYQTWFLLHFFTLLSVYYIVGHLVMFNDQMQSKESKISISSWEFPFDPQIVGKMKYPTKKVIEYCESENKRNNQLPAANYLSFFIKCLGNILERFPKINSSVCFGKVATF